jgi:hypothetical protein
MPAFIAIILLAIGLQYVMFRLQPYLPDRGELPLLPDYVVWHDRAMEGDIVARILWLVGDMTEGAFFKSVPASIALVVFGIFGSRVAIARAALNASVSSESRTFLTTMLWSVLSCGLAIIVFGWTLDGGWTPTFTAFLLTQILIGHYGTSPVRSATVAVLAGIIPCPLSLFLMDRVSIPFRLPSFTAVGLGMALSTVIICEVCRFLPWMWRGGHLGLPPAGPAVSAGRRTMHEARLAFASRVLADIGDMPAVGGAWTGAGMVFGLIFGWELNSAHAVYGMPVAGNLISALVITSAIAVFMNYEEIRLVGDVVTFPALLVVGAITVTYANAWPILVPVILASACIIPHLVTWAIRMTPVPDRYPNSVYAHTIAAIACATLSVYANAISVVIS